MKISKLKSVSLVITAMILTLLLSVGSFAAPGDIKYIIKGTNIAPVQDGVISDGEYNEPIVLDGSGKNTESGGWVGEWAGQVIKYYFTWDKTNLYIGVTVEGDISVSQDGPAADDWFRNGDMVQIGFNPAYEIMDAMPVILGIGFTADAQPVIRGDAYRSLTEGEQTCDITAEIKGYSKTYSAEGINYCCEVIVPWDDYVFVNGLGRESDGSPRVDFSGMTAKAGLEIGLWLVYVDDFDGTGGTEGDLCFRTDQTTGGAWVAQEMSSLALVLADAPAIEAETAPETDAVPVETPVAAQTSDVLAIPAVILAVAACVIIFKKFKQQDGE